MLKRKREENIVPISFPDMTFTFHDEKNQKHVIPYTRELAHRISKVWAVALEGSKAGTTNIVLKDGISLSMVERILHAFFHSPGITDLSIRWQMDLSLEELESMFSFCHQYQLEALSNILLESISLKDDRNAVCYCKILGLYFASPGSSKNIPTNTMECLDKIFKKVDAVKNIPELPKEAMRYYLTSKEKQEGLVKSLKYQYNIRLKGKTIKCTDCQQFNYYFKDYF